MNRSPRIEDQVIARRWSPSAAISTRWLRSPIRRQRWWRRPSGEGCRRRAGRAAPWSGGGRGLRRRMAFLHRALGDPWPDVSRTDEERCWTDRIRDLARPRGWRAGHGARTCSGVDDARRPADCVPGRGRPAQREPRRERVRVPSGSRASAWTTATSRCAQRCGSRGSSAGPTPGSPTGACPCCCLPRPGRGGGRRPGVLLDLAAHRCAPSCAGALPQTRLADDPTNWPPARGVRRPGSWRGSSPLRHGDARPALPRRAVSEQPARPVRSTGDLERPGQRRGQSSPAYTSIAPGSTTNFPGCRRSRSRSRRA